MGAKTEYQKETKEWNVAVRLQAEKDMTLSNFSDKVTIKIPLLNNKIR